MADFEKALAELFPQPPQEVLDLQEVVRFALRNNENLEAVRKAISEKKFIEGALQKRVELIEGVIAAIDQMNVDYADGKRSTIMCDLHMSMTPNMTLEAYYEHVINSINGELPGVTISDRTEKLDSHLTD